jgi:hypothetical protein
MAYDDESLTRSIANARSASPELHNEVWKLLGELLRGRLSERVLPAGELSNVADRLLATAQVTLTTPQDHGA